MTFAIRITIQILIFTLCLGNHTYAAELHAIIVCDTHAIDLEDSVKLDCRRIKDELRRIAALTGLELTMEIISGKNVDAAFFDSIKALKTHRDDVIFFYWSGHGIRFGSQKDPWPYFDFEYDQNDVLSLLDVTIELMKKKARLILSIADCCNDYESNDKSLDLYSKHRLLATREYNPKIKSTITVEGYRKLFLQARGAYIASAAMPGESSISYDEDDEEFNIPGGSFFTNSILEVLHAEVQKGHGLTWDHIFELAALKSIEYQLRDKEDPTVYHHPQYQRL